LTHNTLDCLFLSLILLIHSSLTSLSSYFVLFWSVRLENSILWLGGSWKCVCCSRILWCPTWWGSVHHLSRRSTWSHEHRTLALLWFLCSRRSTRIILFTLWTKRFSTVDSNLNNQYILHTFLKRRWKQNNKLHFHSQNNWEFSLIVLNFYSLTFYTEKDYLLDEKISIIKERNLLDKKLYTITENEIDPRLVWLLRYIIDPSPSIHTLNIKNTHIKHIKHTKHTKHTKHNTHTKHTLSLHLLIFLKNDLKPIQI
jgi:hypothetical protein